MDRRGFLKILGLTPLLPLAAKLPKLTPVSKPVVKHVWIDDFDILDAQSAYAHRHAIWVNQMKDQIMLEALRNAH